MVNFAGAALAGAAFFATTFLAGAALAGAAFFAGIDFLATALAAFLGVAIVLIKLPFWKREF